MLARTDGGKATQQAQRRRVLQRVRDHVSQEYRVCIGCSQRFRLQIGEQFKFASDGAQVEHDRGQHLRLRVGLGDPTGKVVAPDPHGLTPARIGRHHVTRAIEIRAGVQTVRDKLCQCREIRHIGIRQTVIQHQAIVLVRYAGLLLPTLRTTGKPQVGHRRCA